MNRDSQLWLGCALTHSSIVKSKHQHWWKKKQSIWSKKRSIGKRKKKQNEKQTSWIGRKPDGLFDIKKPLWHFRKAVPEWFPRNFRKAWYKTHRYLSNIHRNLLFYLQTETCVPGPLQPPSPCHFTDLVPQRFPHNICLSSSFPLISCPCLHLLQSPISLSDCPSSPKQWTRSLSFYFPSNDSCDSTCNAVCASGTTASLHLKHFRDTHICCFRAQRDMPWQRLFEVASQGEPEPEQGISGTVKKR